MGNHECGKSRNQKDSQCDSDEPFFLFKLNAMFIEIIDDCCNCADPGQNDRWSEREKPVDGKDAGTDETGDENKLNKEPISPPSRRYSSEENRFVAIVVVLCFVALMLLYLFTH